MEENEVMNPEVEETKETTTEESVVEETTENNTAEETPTMESVEGEEVKEGDPNAIPPEGEGVTMNGASAMGALGGLLGGMLGGAAGAGGDGEGGYKKLFGDQIKLFTVFEKDIEDLKTSNKNVQASLTFTKKYIQYLTKAILISDAVLLLIILALIIFK